MMNKLKFLSIVLFSCSLVLNAQKDKGEVVMHIDGNPIYASEFKSIYEKNNPDPDYSKEALDEYLDLFINFKLKVTEAKNQQYDTIPKLVRELKGYRKQLAQPYLVDKQMSEELIKEAYNRLKKEIRASHILIKLPNNPAPDDTVKAYNKIMKLRERIINGEDFSKVAKEASQDPSASRNGGDLGYFTALQMVYPFEEAAYSTKEGEVSMPVQTRFGYHILKVNDVRDARGKMNAAHIMIALGKNPSEQDIKDAQKKINEIYDLLEEGEDFASLAAKYSDDNSSKMRGGKLPSFGSGTQQRMVPEFEDAAFSLENDGDYSEPFKTQFGFHIVKRLELSPLEAYEKMKPELKSKINKDSRSQKSKASFINKLKKEYKYKDYSNKRMDDILAQVDSSIFNFKWKFESSDEKGLTKKLFKFEDQVFNGNDFLHYLEQNQRRFRSETIEQMVQKAYETFVEDEIYQYESDNLEDKYPEFCQLMMEYRDGILLFEITEDKVWAKAMKDTVGLKEFYEKHKESYRWPTRYKVVYFDCKTKDIAEKVKSLLKDSVSADSIAKTINQESSLNTVVKKGLFSDEELKMADLSQVDEPAVVGVKQYNDKFYVIHVKEVQSPRIKKLDEIRGTITSAYQNHLEIEWINSLRDKYEVKINEDVLYNLK